MSIISVSSVGLLWSVNAVRDNRQRMTYISSVTSLETALVDGLMTKSNYTTDAKNAMKAGGTPNITMTLRPAGYAEIPNFNVGNTLTLTETLTPCQGFGEGGCVIRLETALRRITSGTRTHFAYAYRIATNDKSVAFNYSGAGAESATSTFADSDFKLAVPYDFYLDRELVGCTQGEDMALSGIDVTTGKPICIKQPRQADLCADGTLPKSLTYFYDESGNRRIKLECGAPIKSASCPRNYFLQDIDTRTLDGNSDQRKTGHCVYAGRSIASTSIPRSANRISGRVCPRGYRSRSNCYIDQGSIRESAGQCPWCWGAALDCGNSVVTESPPNSGQYRRTTNYFCSDSTPKRQEPKAGRAVLDENSPEDGYADCRIQYAQQDCGATWTAKVRLDVTCELVNSQQYPERVNVQ